MAYNVKFLKGTQEAYNALKTANKLDANTFYYVGNNKFFLGEIELDNEDVKSTINALAAVATSGAAGDVSIADEDGLFEASTVEAALAELAGAIDTLESDSAVTVENVTADQSTYAGVYEISQGGTLIGTINIPKDMVVSSGQVKVVETANTPYQGAAVGDSYIELTLANATNDKIYIPANALVEYVSGGTATDGMITTSVNSSTHVLTASINDGTITKGKLASAVQTSLGYADTSVQDIAEGATNGTIKFKSTGDAAEYSEVAVHGLGSAAYTDASAYDAAGTATTEIAKLDGSATIATVSGNVVTIKAGISEVDGVIDNSSGTDIALEEVAYTGAASDVSIADAGNIITATTVEAALAEIKTQANATDTAILAMDYDGDASTSVTGALAVMTGITQADGVITGIDSGAADPAGAAATAESNAKNYVDVALTWGSFPSAS